jgi:hypothetical protein
MELLSFRERLEVSLPSIPWSETYILFKKLNQPRPVGMADWAIKDSELYKKLR